MGCKDLASETPQTVPWSCILFSSSLPSPAPQSLGRVFLACVDVVCQPFPPANPLGRHAVPSRGAGPIDLPIPESSQTMIPHAKQHGLFVFTAAWKMWFALDSLERLTERLGSISTCRAPVSPSYLKTRTSRCTPISRMGQLNLICESPGCTASSSMQVVWPPELSGQQQGGPLESFSNDSSLSCCV